MSEAYFPYHEQLTLKNFTAFREAHFEFVPGVNVLIGENGTGKTHVLKLLYGASYEVSSMDVSLLDIANPLFLLDDLRKLNRTHEQAKMSFKVSGALRGFSWYFESTAVGESLVGSGAQDIFQGHPPVFIPSVDMIGHTKNFLSTYDRYNIDFDRTYRDIVSWLLSPTLKELSAEQKQLVDKLESVLGGTVRLEGERFYLKSKDFDLPMPSVAEGLRKIATLVWLIKVGALEPGSTLYWDEPETNLNPSLMDEVVSAILELTRSGVQVFIATHSYIILRELEVQSKPGDKLKFFALEATKDGSKVHSANTYLELSPNKIEDQYADLYGRKIQKELDYEQ